MTDQVENWFAGLNMAQRELATPLRHIALGRIDDVREELKWGQPCYYTPHSSALICYIQKAKTHVSFGFARGAEMSDPDRNLSGTGGQMRHLKFRLGEPLDQSLVNRFLDKALDLPE